MTEGRPNLVLAAAVGYDWSKLQPFVVSLRRSCPRATIALLVGETDAETSAALSQHHVISIRVNNPWRWLPARIARQRFNTRRFGWAHRGLMNVIVHAPAPRSLRTLALACLGPHFHHPACSRYFYYYRFLRRQAGRFRQVLLSDVRDVVFQADPFLRPAAEGRVFLEHAATHGRDAGNDKWVEMAFGAGGRRALAGRRVTCSGLTIAPEAMMLDYLSRMTWELAQRTDRLAGHDGVDQGVHNWLYWTGRLPGFAGCENFTGPVLTMHGLPPELIQIRSDDQVTDRAGIPVPVLHQYDRHPAIAARVVRRAIGADAAPAAPRPPEAVPTGPSRPGL